MIKIVPIEDDEPLAEMVCGLLRIEGYEFFWGQIVIYEPEGVLLCQFDGTENRLWV
ncbi:hypothetical protein [Oceanospirillum sediminis]|uniref:Uncharacterized protein n=1 Tax=Oceanospirillum sediminis TaxID=2760088 RepID=A0A839IYR4_9GAMM|nr:hypothetical protein [Oceanospirillum sediminis]MBB1489507.1 hypothetical protein [Oceanospirillum sediminis]